MVRLKTFKSSREASRMYISKEENNSISIYFGDYGDGVQIAVMPCGEITVESTYEGGCVLVKETLTHDALNQFIDAINTAKKDD